MRCCSLHQPRGPMGTQGPPGLKGRPQADGALSPERAGSTCPRCLLLGKVLSLRARASVCTAVLACTSLAPAMREDEGLFFLKNMEGLSFLSRSLLASSKHSTGSGMI